MKNLKSLIFPHAVPPPECAADMYRLVLHLRNYRGWGFFSSVEQGHWLKRNLHKICDLKVISLACAYAGHDYLVSCELYLQICVR